VSQVEVTCEKCGVVLFPTTCFFTGPDGQPECEAGGWHKQRLDVYDPEAAQRLLDIEARR
jgi:hypothetical protein